MASRYFHTFEPIKILKLLQTFKRCCDVLTIKEGASMWGLTTFLKVPAKETRQSRIEREWAKIPESLLTYFQDINSCVLMERKTVSSELKPKLVDV